MMSTQFTIAASCFPIPTRSRRRLLNEFRYGFTNVTTSVNFPIQGSDALSQLDLTGVNISQHPTTHAFPTFNFSAGTGLTPIGRDKAGITQSKTTQFSDNLTYTFGKHTVERRSRYPPGSVLRSGKLCS